MKYKSNNKFLEIQLFSRSITIERNVLPSGTRAKKMLRKADLEITPKSYEIICNNTK
jgi:hypothetical protein